MEAKNGLHVGIYTRKSKLTDKGDSIKNQIDICREYIKQFYLENGTEGIETIYEDEGYSGGTIDRPAFHRLLADVKRGKLDIVACYKLDRISRSVSDFSAVLELLNSHKVSFISVKERFDTSTPIGRAMMYIASVFAQLERETIAERIRDNMRRLARTGRWLGGVAPIGFASEKKQYIDSHNNKKFYFTLKPVEQELNTVRLLFHKYAACASLSGVIAYAKDSGLHTKKGADFCSRSLKNMLSNPVYVLSDEAIWNYYHSLGCDMVNPPSAYCGNGLLLTNRYNQSVKNKTTENPPTAWMLTAASHKGIIDSGTFLAVQRLLDKNKAAGPRTASSACALVSSLLLCPCCGSKMSVTHRSNTIHGKKHYYYKCRLKTASKGSQCSMENLNGEAIDFSLVKELEALSANNCQLVADRLKKQRARFSGGAAPSFRPVKTEQAIQSLKDKIQTLTVQLADNASSSATKHIISQIEAYDRTLAAYEKELEKELSSYGNPAYGEEDSVFQREFEKILPLAGPVSQMAFSDKKAYIQAVVKEITVSNGVLAITLKE